MKIKKVVIPVAGKATRFLPITKTISKTMLPLIDKPVIQYLLQEALDAQIEEALIIIGNNQEDVIDYFDMNSSYIANLDKEYKELEELKDLTNKIKITFSIQPVAKGLGDAIKYAKKFVGNDDFAVILGDDFVNHTNESHYGIASLCNAYDTLNSYIIGVKEVSIEQTAKYGVVRAKEKVSRLFEIDKFVEKPISNPPSNMASVGRYILKNSIFSYLENLNEGIGNEIQLTDAIAKALENESVMACVFDGTRYDIGSKEGYIEAINALALKYKGK